MARRSYTSKRSEPNPDAPRLEFELDGVVFTSDGNLALMDISEFARLANEGMDTDSPKGLAIIAELFLALLGETTYQRFRRHCREHGTGEDVMVAIIGELLTEEADRPTVRPSDSSDGPTATPDTVTVVSFSRATVEQQEKQEEPQVRSYG